MHVGMFMHFGMVMAVLLCRFHDCPADWLSRRKSGKKFLPAMFATEIKSLTVALGAQCGRLIHHHAANGVGCHRRTTWAKSTKYPERNLMQRRRYAPFDRATGSTLQFQADYGSQMARQNCTDIEGLTELVILIVPDGSMLVLTEVHVSKLAEL